MLYLAKRNDGTTFFLSTGQKELKLERISHATAARRFVAQLKSANNRTTQAVSPRRGEEALATA
jgi:hypothetical protein